MSGTSVTARIAKEQNKKIFAIPHEIDNKKGVGTNKLIKKGAILTTSTKEIIEEFSFLEYKKVEKVKKDDDFKNTKTQDIKDKEQREVYELIVSGVNNINEIYEKSNKTINQINSLLLTLEIQGYIKKKAGRYECT